jgi:hypothetical protein
VGAPEEQTRWVEQCLAQAVARPKAEELEGVAQGGERRLASMDATALESAAAWPGPVDEPERSAAAAVVEP